MGNTAKESIKQVIEKAYIHGIHGSQDEAVVKSGFHEDFEMLVLGDNGIDKVTVEEWLDRVEGMKRGNPEMWARKRVLRSSWWMPLSMRLWRNCKCTKEKSTSRRIICCCIASKRAGGLFRKYLRFRADGYGNPTTDNQARADKRGA